MRTVLAIILFSQMCWSQSDTATTLFEGDVAMMSDDFVLAKAKYLSAYQRDSLNVRAMYGLATTELKLGETGNACEHFYLAYLHGDRKALEELKNNCPNFRNGSIMSVDDVDEKPKFIYKEKEYPLFLNGNLNIVFLGALEKEIKRSELLKNKIKGKLFVFFHINNLGIFDGKIINSAPATVKMEMMRIFRSFTYIPARHNGKVVELLERWSLPLDFGPGY